MAVPIRKRLVTVEEFQRMAENGVFSEDERLELIRGEIVEMTPIGGPHAGSVRLLNNRLQSRLGSRAIVDVQNPVSVGEQQSMLYPDLMLLRLREDFYLREIPKSRDVLLVIEVSDSSLAYDRNVKIPLYAESGIQEAWLIDLKTETIFVFRQPSAMGYQEVHQYRRGDTISPEAFPKDLFPVDSILG